MAKIQTEIRLIKVKETFEQVKKEMHSQWMELNEDTTFYGELSGKYYESEKKIILNRNHIMEVYE